MIVPLQSLACIALERDFDKMSGSIFVYVFDFVCKGVFTLKQKKTFVLFCGCICFVII